MTYNAAAARAKRPCPLWVDAFLRDTQHLAADEVGAYMLILMVMWSRESCDYPDDDHRLARVCRVSLRLWKSRLGPTIRPFFQAAGGVLISKRLREEAAYTERQCRLQSDRKTAEKSDKALEYNEPVPTADEPRSNPAATADQPTQLPNNPTLGGVGVGRACAREASLFERVLVAVGLNPADRLPTYWMPPTGEMHVNGWRSLGLTDDEIVLVAEGSRQNHRDPPNGPRALDNHLRRFAGQKHAEALTPAIPQPSTGGATSGRSPSRSRSTEALDAFLAGASDFTR